MVGRHAGESLVSTDIRRHNLALVARGLLDAGPSSRSALATTTGLTRGSVTALTAALLDAGILSEAAPGPRSSGSEDPDDRPAGHAPPPRGRPVTLLSLAADDTAILILQLDADQAIAELSALDGTLLTRVARQHGRPMAQPDAIITVLAGVLTEALDAADEQGRRVVDTTVIVFAPVHGDPPVVVADTDLAWGTVDLLAGLSIREPRLDAAAALRSDAPLAAVAELRALTPASATEPIHDLVYLKSNSGIGGAVIVDGGIVTGAHGIAGALGHLPIVPDGERCSCGQIGCLVTVAGPDALLEAAGMRAALDHLGLGAALEIFVERVLAGEAEARAAWEHAAGWIARTLRILAGTLDPQVIVLGGSWAPLTSTIEQLFQRDPPNVVGAEALPTLRVLPGRLGDRAALIGAALLARERLLADPLALAAY